MFWFSGGCSGGCGFFRTSGFGCGTWRRIGNRGTGRRGVGTGGTIVTHVSPGQKKIIELRGWSRIIKILRKCTGSGIVRRTIRMPRCTSNSNYEVPLDSTKHFLTESGQREQRKRWTLREQEQRDSYSKGTSHLYDD
jgi:hypothetical protein